MVRYGLLIECRDRVPLVGLGSAGYPRISSCARRSPRQRGRRRHVNALVRKIVAGEDEADSDRVCLRAGAAGRGPRPRRCWSTRAGPSLSRSRLPRPPRASPTPWSESGSARCGRWRSSWSGSWTSRRRLVGAMLSLFEWASSGGMRRVGRGSRVGAPFGVAGAPPLFPTGFPFGFAQPGSACESRASCETWHASHQKAQRSTRGSQ